MVVICGIVVNMLCSKNLCDGAIGICLMIFVNLGGVCDDLNVCITLDICNIMGICVGILKVCNDGNFCNGVESCDVVIGVCIFGQLF